MSRQVSYPLDPHLIVPRIRTIDTDLVLLLIVCTLFDNYYLIIL